MSYIIAFVSFSSLNENLYPAQCFRTDLKPNDAVIVRKPDGSLKLASVIKTQYLNWDCRGSIECKADEAHIEKGNINLTLTNTKKFI